MEKKEMKKSLALFLILVLSLMALICMLNYAFASFSLGNPSNNIQEIYAPGENLKGWINLSFSNTPLNSVFRFHNSNSTLKDVLENYNSNLNYACNPVSCDDSYSTIDSGNTAKIFTINSGQSKIIGLRIKGRFDNVVNFSLKISSNSQKSCLNPLVITLLNELEWKSSKSSGDYNCFNEIKYGKYEDNLKSSSPAVIRTEKFCSKILVKQTPSLKIGARVIGSGSANFMMSLLDSDLALIRDCNFSASSSGEYGCAANYSVEDENDYYVCISKISGNEYKINYDENSSQGFWENHNGEYDWQIFAIPGSYDSLGSFVLNARNLNDISGEINSYINNVYSSNCSSGCIIPIKFTSKINSQQITLSNASLVYEVGPSQYAEKNLYTLAKVPGLVTMPFSEISLYNSGLKVPNSPGNYNISLSLNNTQLFSKPIKILELPVISDFYPDEVPAAINTRFVAVVSGNASLFRWYFGDNSTEQTRENFAVHKYNSIGSYELVLSAENSNGQANKTFFISVISPAFYINSSLNILSSRLSSFSSAINNLPGVVKNYIEDSLNLSSVSAEISSLKNDYENAAGDSEKYIEIANNLNDIYIPDSANLSSKLSGSFIVNPDVISIGDMNRLSNQGFEASKADDIKNSLPKWFGDSLDASLDARVYSYVLNKKAQAGFSYIKVELTAKKALEKLFVIANKKIAASNLNIADVDSGSGIIIDSLGEGEKKTIEILFSGGFDAAEIPVYMFPVKSILLPEINVSGCNNNGKCDEDRGENWKNCRNDCKPWAKAFLYILIVLFFVFIVYIILQEWYKKKYQGYLFKNKNELYNIISFMSNAEKSGLKKEDIFAKLNEKKWDYEKINFAYKKFKGKRTGMWEIPVFKFFENKKIKREIEARKIQGNNMPLPVYKKFPVQNKSGFNYRQSQNKYQAINSKDIQKKIFGNPARIIPGNNYQNENILQQNQRQENKKTESNQNSQK
jgi:PKD repeat protein